MQCQKNRFPILELGIGISYQDGPPAFLFDENNKIMISPAINQADRLSSCTKSFKKRFESVRKPFNIYILKARNSHFIADQEETYIRYNVNGIELSPAAFMKLTEEIELQAIEAVFPEIINEKIKIYMGKFQTVSGKFKKLLIREAEIPEAVSETEGGNIQTAKKYFEVVTNPNLYHCVEEGTHPSLRQFRRHLGAVQAKPRVT